MIFLYESNTKHLNSEYSDDLKKNFFSSISHPPSLNFFFSSFIWKAESQRNRERDRESSCICWLTPQMATMAGAGPVWSHKLQAYFQVSHISSGIQASGPLPSQGISRELVARWSNQDINWCSCCLLVSQMAASPSMLCFTALTALLWWIFILGFICIWNF